MIEMVLSLGWVLFVYLFSVLFIHFVSDSSFSYMGEREL